MSRYESLGGTGINVFALCEKVDRSRIQVFSNCIFSRQDLYLHLDYGIRESLNPVLTAVQDTDVWVNDRDGIKPGPHGWLLHFKELIHCYCSFSDRYFLF